MTYVLDQQRPPRDCHLFEYKDAPIPYSTAWDWQKRIVEQRVRRDSPDPRDVLLLLEHPPVYTLGRRGAEGANLKFDPSSNDFEVHRVDRGGDVTHHCPGQLVGYPILDLQHYKKDLHWCEPAFPASVPIP